MSVHRCIVSIFIVIVGIAFDGLLARQDADVIHDALSEFRNGHYEEVVRRLQVYLQQEPRDAAAHHLLGLTFAVQGDDQEALKNLTRSLELSPGNSLFAVNLARFCLGRGERAQAIQVLTNVLHYEETPEVYRMLGLIKLDERDGAGAIACFAKALELSPDDVQSWYYMGLTHHAYGHFDEAKVAYQEGLKRSPEDFYCHFQLGKIYALHRDWTEALAEFQAAEAVENGSAEVCRYLSQAFLALGQTDDALRTAERAVELNPEDGPTQYQLGKTLIRMGRTQDARGHLEYLDRQGTDTEPTLSDHWKLVFRGAASGPK